MHEHAATSVTTKWYGGASPGSYAPLFGNNVCGATPNAFLNA